MVESGHLEGAIWAIADGRGTDADRAVLHDGGIAAQWALARLIGETEEQLSAVRGLAGEERDQVVADITSSLDGLLDLAAELLPSHARRPDEQQAHAAALDALRPPDEVVLQASWSAGQIVVWAGARGADPEPNDQLASRLEAAGAPPHGWDVHPGVPLPNGVTAEALVIHVKDALGWLVAICGEREPVGMGQSLLWISRAALEGVRLAASGAIVPKLDVSSRSEGRGAEARVRWVPALTDPARIDALAAAMPRTVTALVNDGTRNTTLAVIGGVIQTIVTQSVERIELPAQPPRAITPTDLVDTIVARMDGVAFTADRGLAKEMSRRIDQWTRAVADARHQPLVVRLDPPSTHGVWMLAVQVQGDDGTLVPVAEAMRAAAGRAVANEWARLEKMFPPLRRADPSQRGQVALGQDEAWEFMSHTGPMLASIGFDVRAPELKPRPARPALHMFTEVRAGSTVGANQLSDVRWSVVFDDVELSAADIARLAKQARPMVQSHGAWVEIDRVDLERAAEALAERADVTQLTGAEILRQSMGIDAALGGAVVVHGDSWAKDIVTRARESQATLDESPAHFAGTLRSYQAEALAWIGFLQASDLGGCLALDMGLGKTPTVLAHLARSAGDGTALVIGPAAVVGNWAAEAARFAPDLRVLVHHGAARATDAQLEKEIAEADLVITTYATAVRDVEALAAAEWTTMVLDEAQAIKNPASETAQQLRRFQARTKLCLTGTPIENGVGDLWAILDFTNPGLVGPRPVFVAQMSGDGESALRALNGVLLFRRTKAEPEVAAELPDKIDELDHCTMTPEQIGLYQAVLDELLTKAADPAADVSKGAVLAAITALKQICNHPAAYHDDGQPLTGRSGKLSRLEEIVDSVFAADERILIFTHFASWGRRLAAHLSERFGKRIECYDGELTRTARDRMIAEFQRGEGAGAMVLSLKAGGTGLNLTAANHVILYDRWWNPAIEDQARDRAWRLGQNKTVISHRLVCPGTIDERVEEVVQGKRHIAGMVLPKSSSIADLDVAQLSLAFGLRPDELLTDEAGHDTGPDPAAEPDADAAAAPTPELQEAGR